MGWYGTYKTLERYIESDTFKKMNAEANPNDPKTALALAIRALYNDINPWGHKI
jgi:hypothetical protein